VATSSRVFTTPVFTTPVFTTPRTTTTARSSTIDLNEPLEETTTSTTRRTTTTGTTRELSETSFQVAGGIPSSTGQVGGGGTGGEWLVVGLVYVLQCMGI
jgi:hypothetical protein